ncbi:SDR family oxidoreductase [Salinisphaera aquimarina]|uniref:Peroxisomal trans-2-enoyl-CoA reductase n=1 Tax=Salinisphaera aquimarina TaxID=2094031 RepID=A0ABV7EW84_9GAMM
MYQSVFRPQVFAGQRIVVTGGGSGIGRCTAHELASLGADVIITGRSIDKLEATAAEIVADGGRAAIKAFDIRDEEAVREAITAMLAEHGPIHGLVNNAGGQYPMPLAQIGRKGWDAVVANNLTGGFLVAREIYNQCMADNGGAIVNMLADMWNGMPGMGHSGAARAGMLNFTESAAVEWAPSGVRVNAVAPGYIASSGMDHYDPAFARAIIPQCRKATPLKRLGKEAEVSAAIVFLLSPAAAFITGSCIKIDGGSSLSAGLFGVPDHDRSVAYGGFHRAAPPRASLPEDAP